MVKENVMANKKIKSIRTASVKSKKIHLKHIAASIAAWVMATKGAVR